MTDPTALPNFGQTPAPQGGAPTPSAQQAQASETTEIDPQIIAAMNALNEKIVEVLASFDFNPTIDSDGDIMYTVDGQTMFVRLMAGELPLVRMFGQWQIGDDIAGDITKRLNAANDVTLSLNIIKVGIARDMLVVSGEHLVTPDLDLNLVLPSTTQMILQATHLWHQSISAQGPHAAEGGVPAFALEDGSQA